MIPDIIHFYWAIRAWRPSVNSEVGQIAACFWAIKHDTPSVSKIVPYDVTLTAKEHGAKIACVYFFNLLGL